MSKNPSFTIGTKCAPAENILLDIKNAGFSKSRGLIRSGRRIIKKIVKLTQVIIYLPFSITILFVVRLLRPFVIVRFGCLPAERIGDFVSYTEVYFCERDASVCRRPRYDIFWISKPVSNQQLKKMWSRVLNISTLPDIVSLTLMLNRFFPGYKEHSIALERSTDTRDFYTRTPPHLNFTVKEERLGQALLKKIGIHDNSPFVCFHARDPAYLNTVYPTLNDWRYHDHRDSNINNYIPAAEQLANRGYSVFRMGAIVNEPLIGKNAMIVDYATKYRTDFLDIFLSAKCNFFVGSVSGIDEVPKIFRRKVVCVNCIPLEFIFIWNHILLFIPKKLKLKKENRFLTFSEIIISGIGCLDRSKLYLERGIVPVENTPEEISDLVIEAEERLRGVWSGSKEDEALQEQFWNILKLSKSYRPVSSRVGSKFLRQNTNLLK